MCLVFAVSETLYSRIWTDTTIYCVIVASTTEGLTSGRFDILGNSDAIVRRGAVTCI